MILFTEEDRQMLNHVVDVIGDRLHHDDNYTDQDRRTLDKLDRLAKTPATAVVLTGEEQSTHDAGTLLVHIVRTEMEHWVPNASQRLLFRAGAALGIRQPDSSSASRSDCGPERADHALVSDWIGILYLYRCSNCFRLYKP